MKKAAISIILISTGVVLFMSGVVLGNRYQHLLDPLCPSEPSLAVTTQDLVSDNITIKKGTLVAMRECEYADRFSIMFHAPNKLESGLFEVFKPKTEKEKSDYTKMGIAMAQYGVDPNYPEPGPDQNPGQEMKVEEK